MEVLKIKAGGEVTLYFVSPQKMAGLNKKYLGKKGSTDVLSFPVSLSPLLGDIFICPSVANTQAKKMGHSLKYHALCLAFHGLLHLIGHDHHNPKAKSKMIAMETKLMHHVLGVKNYSLLGDERMLG